jgi:hypothetical protein
LDPIPINPINSNHIEPLELPNHVIPQSPIFNSPMVSVNQIPITQSMNPSMNSSMNQTNSNFNQPNQFDPINSVNFNEQSDSRKASISFNPEPSILEIEPREMESEKLDGISFEDLDSTPVNLEFEEL